METRISQLPIPCINIWDEIGIGKTAFVSNLVDWWSESGLICRQYFLGSNRASEIVHTLNGLVNDLEMEIAKLWTECKSKYGLEARCKHRFLIVLDDMEILSWVNSSRWPDLQKALRILIQHSWDIFWILVSRKPIPWWVQSVALSYQLESLSLNQSVSLASGLLQISPVLVGIEKDSTLRSYYEELIEICLGNPLALETMVAHIKYSSQHKRCDIRSIFYSFFKLEESCLEDQDLFSWTNNYSVRALGKMLDQEKILHDTRSLSLSGRNATYMHAGQSLTGNSAGLSDLKTAKLYLILSLGAFYHTMPENIEPSVTTIAVQRCADYYCLKESRLELQTKLLECVENSIKSKIDARNELLHVFINDKQEDVGDKLRDEAVEAHQQVLALLDGDLACWISDCYVSSYGK